MPRVLIVSPHFPPTNAADMQRVRLVLPYLRSAGWEAEVVAVDSSSVAAPCDTLLCESIPSEVQVHRVKGLGLDWARFPGLGQLYSRVGYALGKRVDALLRSKHFDLVYFSTTQFPIHYLGPRWKSRFGTPFVMDYQDPWVNDYYDRHPTTIPPGGRLKYGVMKWLAEKQEPVVLRACAGITSVSPEYPKQLRQKYDFLTDDWPVQILPFPCDEKDFETVRANSVGQNIFDKNDGKIHWIYVGRGGSDMHTAVRGLFFALRGHIRCDHRLRDRLKIHFVGTSYAAQGKGVQTISPLAQEYGLSEIVSESTDRIPYFQTLQCLLDAQSLLVLGSDDPSYTASKIYPYLLCRKPLLAAFRKESSVVDLLQLVGGGKLVTFDAQSTEQSIGNSIEQHWLRGEAYAQSCQLRDELFEPFKARSQAITLCQFFDRCVTTS